MCVCLVVSNLWILCSFDHDKAVTQVKWSEVNCILFSFVPYTVDTVRGERRQRSSRTLVLHIVVQTCNIKGQTPYQQTTNKQKQIMTWKHIVKMIPLIQGYTIYNSTLELSLRQTKHFRTSACWWGGTTNSEMFLWGKQQKNCSDINSKVS